MCGKTGYVLKCLFVLIVCTFGLLERGDTARGGPPDAEQAVLASLLGIAAWEHRRWGSGRVDQLVERLLNANNRFGCAGVDVDPSMSSLRIAGLGCPR